MTFKKSWPGRGFGKMAGYPQPNEEQLWVLRRFAVALAKNAVTRVRAVSDQAVLRSSTVCIQHNLTQAHWIKYLVLQKLQTTLIDSRLKIGYLAPTRLGHGSWQFCRCSREHHHDSHTHLFLLRRKLIWAPDMSSLPISPVNSLQWKGSFAPEMTIPTISYR